MAGFMAQDSDTRVCNSKIRAAKETLVIRLSCGGERRMGPATHYLRVSAQIPVVRLALFER